MAADNFGACLKFTLKYEGGKSNHPNDPGGRTMAGVTQTVYNSFRVAHDLPIRSVYESTPEERATIYYNQYWAKVHGNDLRLGEDLVVFDLAVNSGVSRALKFWHEANHPQVDVTIRGLCAARMRFLRRLATWRYFGKGWSARVKACEKTALMMLPKGEAHAA